MKLQEIIFIIQTHRRNPVWNSRNFNKTFYIGQTKRILLLFLDDISKSQILATIKNACLPKLICELNATPQKDKLTDSEKSLLSLIR